MKNLFHVCLVSAAFLLTSISVATVDRIVSVDGVKNTRDLSGLTTADGRTVRPGLLIRSGEIDHASAVGKAKIEAMGVTTIVDLRTTREATVNPARWPEGTGPRRYNIPLLENESDLIDEMRNKIQSGTAEEDWMEGVFHDSFGTIASDYSKSIREVFDVLLAQPQGESILFHCSGGKDRTGAVTALILVVLGVSRDQIEADFLMSNVLNNADEMAVEIAREINTANGTNMTPEAVWPSLGVRPEYLDYLYETLESDYGSVEYYIDQELRLSPTEIDYLQSTYLQ